MFCHFLSMFRLAKNLKINLSDFHISSSYANTYDLSICSVTDTHEVTVLFAQPNLPLDHPQIFRISSNGILFSVVPGPAQGDIQTLPPSTLNSHNQPFPSA